MNDTLTIYETFSSIQGESTHAGRLCFFIRLAGCNLRCSYCDTRKAQTVSSGRIRSLDELVNEAERSGLRLIEITGGEPMLQPATPELCRRLLERGFEVLMETNGSVDLSAVPRGTRSASIHSTRVRGSIFPKTGANRIVACSAIRKRRITSSAAS